MSEVVRAAARAGDEEGAYRAAAGLLAEGRREELVEAVLGLLAGDTSWLRDIAISLLRRIRPDAALVDLLLAELASGSHPDRRNAARTSLSTLSAPGSFDPSVPLPRLLERLAHDEDVDVRILAANALGESHNPRAREALEAALHDPQPNVVAAAAEALGELNDPRAVTALIALAERRDFWTGNAAAVALGRLEDPRAIRVLAELTRDPWLAAEAARALGATGDSAALDALQDMMGMPEEQRAEGIRAAAAIVARTGVPTPAWLRAALAEDEAALAERLSDAGDAEAARLLGMTGTGSATQALLNRLREDPDGAAAVGLELTPAAIRAEAILERLPTAPHDELASLLTLLPPLSDRAAIESVARWLADEDAEVRSAAAEALRHADVEHTLQVLDLLRQDPEARLGVALTYGRMGSNQCTPLLEMLQDPDPEVRAAAADGAGRCGLATVERLATALEEEKTPGAARALVRALGTVGGDEAVSALERVLEQGDATLRFEAVRALGCTAAPRAFPLLLSALDDPDPGIRTMALSALGDLGDVRAEEPLARHIDDPDRDRRRMAAAALERLYGEESAARLEGALADPDREVRLVAVTALSRLRLPGTIAALERVAEEDPDPVVRHTAVSMAARLQDPAAEAP